MRKGNFHPDYHNIVVIRPNGERLHMRSTYGKEGSEVVTEFDPCNHVAWTGSLVASESTSSRGMKFKRKFDDLDM